MPVCETVSKASFCVRLNCIAKRYVPVVDTQVQLVYKRVNGYREQLPAFQSFNAQLALKITSRLTAAFLSWRKPKFKERVRPIYNTFVHPHLSHSLR